MIEIHQTTDAKLIATLNKAAQDLHAKLHPDLFKPHDPAAVEKALQGFLNDPNCQCYVAKQGNDYLGYILLFVRDVHENAFHYSRRILYIDQIGVLEKYQKTGVGKLLLQLADKVASELKINRIQLDHWTTNTVAAHFFRKQGYSLFREHLGKDV